MYQTMLKKPDGNVFSGFSFFLCLIFTFSVNISHGQPLPVRPVSYSIFSPVVFNPAMAGSKDYFSVDIISGLHGDSNSQIVTGNARLAKGKPDYLSSHGLHEFNNIGIGGVFFRNSNGPSDYLGINGMVSYHLPLNREATSFISAGASLKMIYNKAGRVPPEDSLAGSRLAEKFSPNADFGIYFYNEAVYAGVSGTNLAGNTSLRDSLGNYKLPLSRQYYFMAGTKILLIRSVEMLIEPSVIVNIDDSLSFNIKHAIKPLIKIYFQDFCFGTYFNNYDNMSFFLQYRYPLVSVGAFADIPRKTAYYRNDIRLEIALGVNLSYTKARYKKYHW